MAEKLQVVASWPPARFISASNTKYVFNVQWGARPEPTRGCGRGVRDVAAPSRRPVPSTVKNTRHRFPAHSRAGLASWNPFTTEEQTRTRSELEHPQGLEAKFQKLGP